LNQKMQRRSQELLRNSFATRFFTVAMGSRARTIAEEFSIEKHAARMMELYERMTSGEMTTGTGTSEIAEINEGPLKCV